MSEFEINGIPVNKLRVVDLKEELEARGLSKSGKKDELIARLVSFLEVNTLIYQDNDVMSRAHVNH